MKPDVIGDESGAESEEEHAAALVAAERLHGGVVDHLHRAAEGGGEIEADPTGPEIVRIRGEDLLKLSQTFFSTSAIHEYEPQIIAGVEVGG